MTSFANEQNSTLIMVYDNSDHSAHPNRKETVNESKSDT